MISEHISYSEATRSDVAKRKGWKNDPNPAQLRRMKILANKVFEPVRIHFMVPIFIWSMFRTPQVNKTIGGATNSQHMAERGAAIDIDAQIFGGTTNKEIFEYIKDTLEFDQLIGEGEKDDDFDWIHVSYNELGNRKQVLIMKIIDGKPTYTNV